MRIAIFGVTCAVGRELIYNALQQGHDVTVVSKNPACLEANEANLEIVKASVEDADSLENALTGRDAVISAIDDQESISNIIQAMQKKQVKRFIGVLSSDTQASNSFLPGILSRFFYSHSINDLSKKCQSLGIEWTLIQPPVLTHEPPTGNYHLYFNGCPIGDKKVSVMDLAEFMIGELSSNQCMGKIVSVAY